MKLLDEIIDVNLCDFGLGNSFFDMKAKHKNNNKKHKLGFTEIKSFCYQKDIIKKVKRQLMEWEIIFSNHVSDKK